MNKQLVYSGGIVLLIILFITYYYTRTRASDTKLAKLTSAAGSTDFTPAEAVKMTIPSILKNTVMSLKPLENIPKAKTYEANEFSMFGQYIGPQGNGTIDVKKIIIDKDKNEVIFATIDGQYVKAVKYNSSTGEVISGLYYEHNLGLTGNGLVDIAKIAVGIEVIGTPNQPGWNIGGKDGYKIKNKQDKNMTDVVKSMILPSQSSNNLVLYPNIIREGLFYIKSNNKYIFKNSVGGLELKDGTANSVNFSDVYQSCTKDTEKEQPMVFYLKLKEKDDAKREYTFYVKNFIGNIASDDSFKNIGIKPFYQAGYHNLEAKFDYGCWEGHQGIVGAKIPAGQRERNLYSDWSGRDDGSGRNDFINDAIDWYKMPFGLKGRAWWDYFEGNINTLNTGTEFPSNECGKGNFNIVPRDEWSTIKIEYEQPDRSCLAITDSTDNDLFCEFKIKLDDNNNWYIEKDGKYLHFWGWQFPSFVDGFNNRHSIELIPVLDEDNSYKYLQASIKYLNDMRKSNRKEYMENFCGSNIKFPDGTLKIYPSSMGKDDKGLLTDPVARAFESICACNMNENFYTELLCNDELIKKDFGIDPADPKNASVIQKIRATMKCSYPTCSFEKCQKFINKGVPYVTDPACEGDKNCNICGSSTLCITNQNINIGEGAVLEGSTINAEAKTRCGLDDVVPKPRMVESGSFLWLDEAKTKLGKEQKCFVEKEGKDVEVDSKTPGCSAVSSKVFLDFEKAIKNRDVTDSTSLRTINISGVSKKVASINNEEIINESKELIYDKYKQEFNLPNITDVGIELRTTGLMISFYVPEPTIEPISDITSEPTRDITPEPTRDITPEPTRDITPEPTRDITPEPTRDITPEPTPEPTRDITPTTTEKKSYTIYIIIFILLLLSVGGYFVLGKKK